MNIGYNLDSNASTLERPYRTLEDIGPEKLSEIEKILREGDLEPDDNNDM